MNEAETRAENIDPALRASGRGVVEGIRVRRKFPITLGRLEGAGRRGKALTADYVLEYRNTKLAMEEAKAWDEPTTAGLAQAKNYAGKRRRSTVHPAIDRPEALVNHYPRPPSRQTSICCRLGLADVLARASSNRYE
ncbi:MAG TPA: hypothetical protein VGL42_10770 [Opitutaceae bacterium]|jgi:type I site-specific restriction endonuclease